MCIYTYIYVCASAYKSRTRRCAGSLKGFSGFAFSRRICAIAITCRIRAGHRVSAIPINAIRVRLCFVIMILHSYTIHIRDPRSRFSTIHIRDSPILAIPSSHSAISFSISIRHTIHIRHSRIRLIPDRLSCRCPNGNPITYSHAIAIANAIAP